jgi:hypothetical protein
MATENPRWGYTRIQGALSAWLKPKAYGIRNDDATLFCEP